jgi:hypothetical protein
VPAARGLIEPLAARLAPENPARLRPLLERSEQAFVSARLGSARPPAAELALTGRFSPELVSLRLGSSCSWVRVESRPGYWRSRSEPLEVCSPKKGLLLAAMGERAGMELLLARPQAYGRQVTGSGPPGYDEPGVAEFVKGAGIYAMLPSLPAAEGVPIRGLWLAAFPEPAGLRPEGLRVNVLFQLAEQGNPRGLQNLVRLLLVSVLRKAGLPDLVSRLKTVEVAVEGASVTVRGLTLSAREVQALLEPLLEPRLGASK